MTAAAVSSSAAELQSLKQQAADFAAFQREASVAHAEIGQLRAEMEQIRVAMRVADERALRAESSLETTRAELAEVQKRHASLQAEWQAAIDVQRTATSKVGALESAVGALGGRVDTLDYEAKIELRRQVSELRATLESWNTAFAFSASAGRELGTTSALSSSPVGHVVGPTSQGRQVGGQLGASVASQEAPLITSELIETIHEHPRLQSQIQAIILRDDLEEAHKMAEIRRFVFENSPESAAQPRRPWMNGSGDGVRTAAPAILS